MCLLRTSLAQKSVEEGETSIRQLPWRLDTSAILAEMPLCGSFPIYRACIIKEIVNVIKLEGVKKSYGKIQALKGINLTIKKGEFLAIFGPNGAGKTTLLKIISGILKPSEGNMVINHPPAITSLSPGERDKEIELSKQIGVISHNTFLYNELTPYENLKFYGQLYHLSDLEGKISRLCAKMGLSERIHTPVRTFSRGMQQRLAIARSLLHNPSILLLDEPYTGLDQHAARLLKEILLALKTPERTIILTTHNLTQGLQMSDQTAVLAKGRIVYHERVTESILKEFDSLYFDLVQRTRG